MAKRKLNKPIPPVPNTIKEYDCAAQGGPFPANETITICESGKADRKAVFKSITSASTFKVKFFIMGPVPRPVATGETFRQDALDAQGLKVVYLHGKAVLKFK